MWTCECNCWMSMQKACNLLHMPQPPNDSVLATFSDTVWILYCRFMDDRSYVGPQGLHRPNAIPINCLFAYRWWNDFPLPIVVVLIGRTPASLASLKLLPECLSQGIYAILLMCQNQYVLCNFIDNSHIGSCNVVLSLQTPIPHPNTESDWLENGMGMACKTTFCSAAIATL